MLCVRDRGFATAKGRAAWVLARLFLAEQGLRLEFDTADAIVVMEGVAGGVISETQLAEWFRIRLLP